MTHQYPSAKYVWYVVILLSVVNVFNYLDRMALSILAPSIQKDLNLSDMQLGLLTGLAFSLFYAICGLPIARWADRGVRRDLIAIALLTWSVMTALSGAAQNFWHLLAARAGIGAGEAGCVPSAQSILCDYVPLERRSGVFAIHNFGLQLGMMSGLMLAGWLSQSIGWRWAFLILGLPGVALAVLVKFTLREPIRGLFDAVKDDGQSHSFRETIRVLWQCRTYRLLTVLVVVNGFVQYGLLQWLPSFYSRVFGLSPASIGVFLGLVIALGSGLGLLAGGLLANKVAQRDMRIPLKLGAVATFFALPSILASLFASSAGVSLALIAVTGFFLSVSNGPVVAVINSVVTSRRRATAQALVIFLTAVLGFGFGPLAVGVLSDLLMPSFGVESLRYALMGPMVLLPVMVVVLHRAAGELPNDLRAAGVHVADTASMVAGTDGKAHASGLAR